MYSTKYQQTSSNINKLEYPFIKYNGTLFSKNVKPLKQINENLLDIVKKIINNSRLNYLIEEAYTNMINNEKEFYNKLSLFNSEFSLDKFHYEINFSGKTNFDLSKFKEVKSPIRYVFDVHTQYISEYDKQKIICPISKDVMCDPVILNCGCPFDDLYRTKYNIRLREFLKQINKYLKYKIAKEISLTNSYCPSCCKPYHSKNDKLRNYNASRIINNLSFEINNYDETSTNLKLYDLSRKFK